MPEWFDALEFYFFTRWRESAPGGVPDAIHKAMRKLGGQKFLVDVVHPVDYADGRIAFVMVKDKETYLFRFDPPETTKITFLGSLAGGRYSETIVAGDLEEGEFSHPRLGDDGPLRVRPEPPETFQRDGVQAAFERTDLLREKFRQWSTEPPPPQSQRAE